MQRWIGVAAALCLCLCSPGCKLEKTTGRPADDTGAIAGLPPELPESAPEDSGDTVEPPVEEEPVEETAPDEETDPDAEPAESEGDESVEAEAELEEAEVEQAPEEKPARFEPTVGTREAGPTPGVQRLSTAANAELVEAHLARSERLLQAERFDSARRVLNHADRALSYLDAQRGSSILSQALDQIAAKVREKNAIGSRRALRLAEEWIEGADVAKAQGETIEELADQLRRKDFAGAATTIQTLQDKLYETTEQEDRLIQSIRTGLVQAQLALDRQSPKVAGAEIAEARVYVRNLGTSEATAP